LQREKTNIIFFTRATLIIESSIFGGVSRAYHLLLSLLGHETLVVDVGEDDTLVDGDVSNVLVGSS
jgi:hypothetical protein